jgi:hypothetical protein
VSRLLDGPLGPLTLGNGRAPRYLRVVQDAVGHVDCLDRPEDVADRSETIQVYELVPGTDHGIALVRTGRPATCIELASGDYRHRPDIDGEPWAAIDVNKRSRVPLCLACIGKLVDGRDLTIKKVTR